MMESILRRKSDIVVKTEPPASDEGEDGDDNPNLASSIMTGILRQSIISSPMKGLKVKSLVNRRPNSVSPPSSSSSTKIIQLGQTFNSFADVLLAIRMYECKNKVNLTQKYFRRIAANPKPSNKEDYSLSVEERKRFVYRWVDFCCTYFDTLLARTDISEEGTAPAIGFTIKECPMRIRFQMRFQEKDLIVSIFRETHDHSHPDSDDPQRGPNASKESVAGRSSFEFGLNNHVPKPNLRPPPSLAPLPSRLSSSSVSSHSPATSSTQQRKNFIGSSIIIPTIPRPPPLKGPGTGMGVTKSASLPTATVVINAVTNDSSTKTIIRNVYNFLLRTKMHRTNGEGSKNGLLITSTNPDLVKLTAEMTGVDPKVVRSIVLGKQFPAKPSFSLNDCMSFSTSSSTETLRPTETPSRRLVKRSVSQNSSHFQDMKRHRSDFNDSDSSDGWTPYTGLNTESSDAYKKLANLPVDITIKPEITSYGSEEEDEEYDYRYIGDDDQDNFFGEQDNMNGR